MFYRKLIVVLIGLGLAIEAVGDTSSEQILIPLTDKNLARV